MSLVSNYSGIIQIYRIIIAMRVSCDLLDLETCLYERIDIGINGSPVAGTLIVFL